MITEKSLMSDYENLEDIDIDLNTPIVHVTHSEEKDQIVENQVFLPSANKNIIGGIWFSLGYQPRSVYGSWAFEKTLASLGVELGYVKVFYKEVNFILYASDTVSPNPVGKATDNAVRAFHNDQQAYRAVSRFVPSRFLPQGAAFGHAFDGPYKVSHQPFCVKVIAHCKYLMG
ncbi:Hypothetical predicted protein [Paramuricea clavata]|uniref:Uncharacterized protein n=1 Tax=Paramuricea clavata TaxID=317549 RepID=A0A7D9HPY0_PARCT|nr:Hypothetical predicted protein [Paramuricea clavata]